jgi:uncharacterized damage-inducible protein DinB
MKSVEARSEEALREQLVNLLAWKDAHANYDQAVDGVPADLRGKRPPGLAWSAWELVEHLRLTQRDILEFCVDSNYKEREWPKDYWPERPQPGSAGAWEKSIESYRKDRAELETLARDPKLDLFAKIPHGTGQTYLRELVLVADHNSYHVGQLVAVRRLLGCWPES